MNREIRTYLAGAAPLLIEPIDVRDLKRAWLEALDSVEPFVAALPPGELGCLYYSLSRGVFVDPAGIEDAVAHHGRPGGVLPRVGDP